MLILTGRPHRLLDESIRRIGELVEENQPCMFLVPSQYTLQAEIEIMSRLNLTGSFLIDVLSPGRLQSRIFERAGAPKEILLDERGKQMIISQIVLEEKDNLNIYQAAAKGDSSGFVAKLSAMIADLKRSGMTAQELYTHAETMQGMEGTKKKLLDTARLFAAYEKLTSGKLADAEDISAKMLEKLPRSKAVKDRHVFVYGFDMITPTFAHEMVMLSDQAASLTLAIETDANAAPDGRLFAPVNASLDRLTKLAKEKGVPIQKEHIDKQLNIAEDLRFLEQNLFALGRKPYSEVPSHITLNAYSTVRAEVNALASQIRDQLANGEDPANIAVVYPKTSNYGAMISSVFRLYGLPVYLAEKRKASAHPLCRMLLSSIAVVSEGWRTGDVQEVVRSGFSPLKDEEADMLCAYVDSMDIRQSAWKRPFEFTKEKNEDSLDALNQSREKIVLPLMNLEKDLKEAENADATISAILQYLDAINAFDTLGDMRMELAKAGLDSEAEDCAQVWNQLIETLDQLHDLLGKTAAPGKLLLRLLRDGLSSLELSALPPAAGAIICGEIGNVRTAEVDTLYAIGMNDIPSGGDEGLLSAAEKEETIRATGAYLGMSTSERAALSMLDELKTFSSARKMLHISLALADETGSALREGIAVQSMRRMFPKLAFSGGMQEEEQLKTLTAPDAMLESLAVALSDAADGREMPQEAYAKAYRAMAENEETQAKLLNITKQLSKTSRERMETTEARRLYGRPVMSVSRLETFASCPYQHFVRYGLAPQQEITPGIDRAELGTLYHKAAEQFTREIMKRPDFPNIETSVCDEIMLSAVSPLINEWQKTPFGESGRGEAIAKRITRTARTTGRNIVRQFSGSSFKPMKMELVFGQNGVAPIMLELADGSFVYLQGRIDRIDVLDEETKTIRIIDYKSGAQKFDATKVYWGLQLQLLIYLAAALMAYPGTQAAGFFYCRIADPTVKTDSRVKEEIERMIAKKLSLEGISLSDVQILRAQDGFHQEMITKDGKPSGKYSASMIDGEGMSQLTAFARLRAAQLAGRIYAGEIEDAPAEIGAWNSCQHCDYTAICGFDPAVKTRRRLSRKKTEDLRQLPETGQN